MTSPRPAEEGSVPLTDGELRALREKAEKATPGPWYVKRSPSVASIFSDKGLVASRWSYSRRDSVAPDAAYLAACDPQTVLRLVDELERLRAENRRLCPSLAERLAHEEPT